MASKPLVGDVIVQRVPEAEDDQSYGVGLFGAPIQLIARTHSDAFKYAETFARRSHVDVWYSAEPDQYSCVARHRLRES